MFFHPSPKNFEKSRNSHDDDEDDLKIVTDADEDKHEFVNLSTMVLISTTHRFVYLSTMVSIIHNAPAKIFTSKIDSKNNLSRENCKYIKFKLKLMYFINLFVIKN